MPEPTVTTPRVLAVVVTYERRALLARLLDALETAPGLAGVLVVDNASTDGTGAWLAARPQGAVPVRHRTLPDNRGGAGGFHEGLAWALEEGADLVWLMDDDGLPEPGCLPALLAHRDRLDFWGPVVVDEADPDRLVFPIRLPGTTRVAHRVDDVARAAGADGLLEGVVIPFNGVLVTRALVARIGLVRSEFFIWGDDHEYRLRAERAGARVATVAGARVHHPSVGELGTPMAFGRTTYNHSPSDLKAYCMARNNLVNLRTYRGWPHVLAFAAKTVWFHLLTRRDLPRLRLMLRGMRDGLRGDFTGHAELLR